VRIPRIHTPQPLDGVTTVLLEPDTSSHLVNVLRLKRNSRCILFNGDGNDYDCYLDVADKRAARLVIESSRRNLAESSLRITLVQAIARGDRMDYLLQKSVELGVRHLVPVFSKYTNVKLPADRLPRKLAHWRKILISACEQSGRSRIPELSTPQPLQTALQTLPDQASRLVLLPDAHHGMQSLKRNDSYIVLAGPEGGFSAAEADMIQQQGFSALRLGPRILRTETAAMAAVSALQGLFGDFR